MLQQRAGAMPGNGDAATASTLEQQNHGTDKGAAHPDGQKKKASARWTTSKARTTAPFVSGTNKASTGGGSGSYTNSTEACTRWARIRHKAEVLSQQQRTRGRVKTVKGGRGGHPRPTDSVFDWRHPQQKTQYATD